MAWLSLLSTLAVFWLAVHAAHHVWARRHASQGLLPTLSTPRRKRLDVTLQHAYLRLETARFNDLHDRVALRFAKGRGALWQRAAYTFKPDGTAEMQHEWDQQVVRVVGCGNGTVEWDGRLLDSCVRVGGRDLEDSLWWLRRLACRCL